MKKTIIAFALFATACATTQPATQQQPCRAADTTINATLWMQTSAEYQAVMREIYGTAYRTLDEALADKTWTAATEQTTVDTSLPPAIILDIDETIVDTSAHQTKQIRTQQPYSEAEWHEWAMHDASRPIEPARDFLQSVAKRGIAIFYITNRVTSEKEPIRATLERNGYPLTADNVITKGDRPEWETSDKSPRRAFVASHYRVLMLFGDDLNDFVAAKGKTVAEREAIVRAHAGDWGRKWFALPNPVYGSWEGALVGGASGCEQLQKKVELLRE